jgi:hypothetical protein
MGSPTQFRTLLSALSLGLLLVTLVSAESIPCGTGISTESGGCCNPDGSCKTSPDNDPPACCLKAGGNDVVAAAQPTSERPVVADVLADGPTSAVPARQPARNFVALAHYSPPDLYLLNSALLI